MDSNDINIIVQNVRWIMSDNKRIADTNRELERIQKDLKKTQI